MTLVAGEAEAADAGESSNGPTRRDPSGELALALQLLRASNMASTRLQLALARRDRRVAMASLDNLAAIDAEFNELAARLNDSAGDRPDLAVILAWLTEEKAALASDKLSLACDVSGAGLVSPPDRLSETGGAEDSAANEPLASQDVLDSGDPASEDERRGFVRRWLPYLLLAILIGALAVAIVVAGVVPGAEKLMGVAELRRLAGAL